MNAGRKNGVSSLQNQEELCEIEMISLDLFLKEIIDPRDVIRGPIQ